jgi:PAS domain S-box-containing protein
MKKINPAFTNKTGISEEELFSKPMIDFIHPQDRLKVITEFEKVITSSTPQTIYSEIRILNSKDEYIWIGLNANLAPETGMVYVVARDINDHKLKELEMKKRLMKYKLEEGNLYLIKEKVPKESLEAFGDLQNIGYDGTVFSRRSLKELKRNLKGDFNYYWLAENDKDPAIKPEVKSIKKEIEKMPLKGAILIDRMDYIAFKNGIKDTISFIQALKEIAYMSNYIVILSIDPDTINNVDMNLLEKECLELEPLHKTMLSNDLVDILKHILNLNSKKVIPTYNSIFDDLNVSRPTARKRLTKLINLGYLIETKKGREKIFELTEKSISILSR